MQEAETIQMRRRASWPLIVRLALPALTALCLAVTGSQASAAAVLSAPGNLGTAAEREVEAQATIVPCGMGCITTVTVQPHGTYASFQVSTRTPATFRIEVSTPPWYPTFRRIVVATASSGTTPVQQWSTDVWSSGAARLYPNTYYEYVLTATDAAGGVERWSGNFRTLRRQVEVAITRIDVIDDSDSLGAGELVFALCLNGHMLARHDFRSADIPLFTDGARIPVNIRATLTNAPDLLTIELLGLDDDKFPLDSIPFFLPHDCNNPWGYDSGRGLQAVSVARVGPGEAFSGTVRLMSGLGDLEFDAHGSFTVRYVP